MEAGTRKLTLIEALVVSVPAFVVSLATFKLLNLVVPGSNERSTAGMIVMLVGLLLGLLVQRALIGWVVRRKEPAPKEEER